MLHAARLVLSVAAFALAVVVTVADERFGIPLESRATVILGLGGLVAWAWSSTQSTPKWLGVLGLCSVGMWLALTWSWATPVDTSVGSCGSTLARQQPAGDQDGVCDRLVGAEYNKVIPLMLLAAGTGMFTGVGAAVGRRRDRAATPSLV